MKPIALLSILLLMAGSVFSQDTPPTTEKSHFIVLYTLGENWDATKAPHEQPYFKEHSSHLSELRKAKKIRIGGRYSDTGMLVLVAENEQEARELITSDVAIQNKLFKVEIFPLNTFYKGCVE